MKHRYSAFILSLMLTAVALAQEAPLLAYQWKGGHSPYKQIGVVITQTGEATVSWQMHEPPPHEYRTTLSPEEVATVKVLIRSTDFFAQSAETSLPEMRHTGETVLAIQSGGQGKTMKYQHLPALAPMVAMIHKLTAQAFALQAIESDGDIGTAACAVIPTLAGEKALQPGAFKKPLMTYASGRHTGHKVRSALEALSYVTTPEEYAGFVSLGLADSSQRNTFLGIIGSHPFCGNIPDAHLKSLCPLYLSFVRDAAAREAELTPMEKGALENFTYLLGETRYEPAIPVLIKWFEAHNRPGITTPLTPLAKMADAGLTALVPYLDSPNENYRNNAIELLVIISRTGPHAGFSNPLNEYEYAQMLPVFDKLMAQLRVLAEKDPSTLVRKTAAVTLVEIQQRVEKERQSAKH